MPKHTALFTVDLPKPVCVCTCMSVCMYVRAYGFLLWGTQKAPLMWPTSPEPTAGISFYGNSGSYDSYSLHSCFCKGSMNGILKKEGWILKQWLWHRPALSIFCQITLSLLYLIINNCISFLNVKFCLFGLVWLSYVCVFPILLHVILHLPCCCIWFSLPTEMQQRVSPIHYLEISKITLTLTIDTLSSLHNL